MSATVTWQQMNLPDCFDQLALAQKRGRFFVVTLIVSSLEVVGAEHDLGADVIEYSLRGLPV
jgi:hypothetical protein